MNYKQFENIKISIVIPVYNTESALRLCIESILCQTYTNLQIIFIDDGSTDGSFEELVKYAKADERIMLIKSYHHGSSVARNIGLDVVDGDFILFCDSDDYLRADAIEILIKLMHEGKYDLSIGRIRRTDCRSLITDTFYRCRFNSVNRNDQNKWMRFVESVDIGIGAKLYRTDIIKNNGIRFPDAMPYGEDAFFLYEYLSHANSIGITGEHLYTYRRCTCNSSSKHGYAGMAEYMYAVQLAYEKALMCNNTEIYEVRKKGLERFAFSMQHYIENLEKFGENAVKSEMKKCIALFSDFLIPGTFCSLRISGAQAYEEFILTSDFDCLYNSLRFIYIQGLKGHLRRFIQKSVYLYRLLEVEM